MTKRQFSPSYLFLSGERNPPRDRRKGNHRGAPGMTLVEVIMVLGIFGILAAVFIPRLDFLTPSSASVAGAAYMIASDIRYAQEFGMANAISKGLHFSSGSNIYHFTPSHSLDPEGRLPSGVAIGNDFTVTFNSHGEPVIGGGGSVTISENAQTKTIQVIPRTGKVNIL